MGISLLNNQPAETVRMELEKNGQDAARAMERLASGKRINHVYDDPAGSAISSALEAKVRSLGQAQRNTMDAMSLIQVAEGGLNELDNIVVRLRELAIQAASDSISDAERGFLQTEFDSLRGEIERIAQSTRYLGNSLLNGTENELVFQIGTDNTEADRISYDTSSVDVRSSTLGIDDISIEDQDEAMDTLSALDEALGKIHLPRAQLGGIQSRLHSVMNFLTIYEENLSTAHGRINDADYAKETTELFRALIHQKAGVAVLAQANQSPAIVLKLLDTSL